MSGFLRKLRKRISGNRIRPDLVCSEIFESVTILADGSVVCGCSDIHEGRLLGNVNKQSLSEIFHSEAYRELRRRMISGKLPPQCVECPVRIRERSGRENIEGGPVIWIQVDPAFNCNLQCPDCALTEMRREKFFIRPRTAMSLDTFKRIIDQASGSLKHMRFHLLGEPFLNPEAASMLEYARNNIPELFISIETNGLLLRPEMRRILIENGIDYVKFSIDGASQETYEKYRVGGDFSLAYQNMADLVSDRRKAQSNRPRVVWQYILFKWNDSEEQIAEAKNLASKAGVDELYWLMTHSPGASERFTPGISHPELKCDICSQNITIELAAREGRPVKRSPLTLNEYNPWK